MAARRCALVLLLIVRAAHADPLEEAARMATQPFFDTNSLQLQPAFTWTPHSANQDQLLLRLSMAYDGLFVPGFNFFPGVYSIARIEMYGQSINQSPVIVGLQDWNGLLLAVKPFHWGAQLALGVYSVLPTATDPALGQREFQLGPAAGAMITHVRHLQIGVLLEFFFSVAGDTPNLITSQVQPIIVYQLPKAFFLKTDGILKLDLNQISQSSLPVNLHFGRAFTPQVVLSAIVEGVTWGSDFGNISVKLNLTYVDW